MLKDLVPTYFTPKSKEKEFASGPGSQKALLLNLWRPADEILPDRDDTLNTGEFHDGEIEKDSVKDCDKRDNLLVS